MVKTLYVINAIDGIEKDVFTAHFIKDIMKRKDFSAFFAYNFEDVPTETRENLRTALKAKRLDLDLDDNEVMDNTVRAIMARAIKAVQ
jgi:hypothetical protein